MPLRLNLLAPLVALLAVLLLARNWIFPQHPHIHLDRIDDMQGKKHVGYFVSTSRSSCALTAG